MVARESVRAGIAGQGIRKRSSQRGAHALEPSVGLPDPPAGLQTGKAHRRLDQAETQRKGNAVDIYRAYFKKCWEATNPGAWFGLQTILRNRVPRNKKDLEDVYFTNKAIFPGGLNPRLEDIIQAVNPYWEVLTCATRREDYGRTTGEWLRRMKLHEKDIRQKWGDKVYGDYDRYLSTCVRAFDQHYSSLAQYELRRID